MLEATVPANRRRCARGASSRWEAQPASERGRTRRCREPGSRRSSGGNGARVGARSLRVRAACPSAHRAGRAGEGGRAGGGPRGSGARAGTCAPDL